jgi:hypothetical protein
MNSIGMRRISKIRSKYLDNRFIKAINNLWAILDGVPKQ